MFYFLKSTRTFGTPVPFRIFFQNFFLAELFIRTYLGSNDHSSLLVPGMLVELTHLLKKACSFRTLDFGGSAFQPFAFIICHKYLISDEKFTFIQTKFQAILLYFLETFLTCSACYFRFSFLIKMSSKKATAKSILFNNV